MEAVKNIKIDKITVWDGGNNPEGSTSTVNFVSGMMKTVPPLNDLFTWQDLIFVLLKGNHKRGFRLLNKTEDKYHNKIREQFIYH